MQQQRIPEELTPDEEAIIGDPIVGGGRPEFVENREWDRIETYTVEWGTHRFRAVTAAVAEGDDVYRMYTGIKRGTAPREAPPAAEDILRDLAARGSPDCFVAVSLAEGWGMDLDELGDAGDHVREEVRA